MRVGLNLLYLRPGGVGGSEVYCRELARHLAAEPEVDLTLFCGAEAAATFDPAPNQRVVQVSARPFSQARRLIDENLTLAASLRRAPVDVLLSPANFIAPALPARVPQVATVHDLQHLWFPEHFSRTQRAARNALFAATFLRARRLIAISDFTARDLEARFHVPRRRVRTVLEGIDRAAQPSPARLVEVRRAYQLDAPFLYYPAASAPHKDHLGLVTAFARLVAQHPGDHRDGRVELILTGQRTAHWDAVQARIDGLRLTGRVRHLGFVPRADVFPLMKLARALVFPSTFEGFGLPLLEAMQCDTPVVAARRASIPEVTGDAAELLEPGDSEAWAAAMHRALTDEPWRQRLVTAGRANLDRFSWTRCARETLSVLREAAR